MNNFLQLETQLILIMNFPKINGLIIIIEMNSDNFLLAAETLANKGYKIFRLGRRLKNHLHQNSNIIDYANSEFRSDFLDLFIGKVCKFGVSTGTGIENVATVFRKPLCITAFHLNFHIFIVET